MTKANIKRLITSLNKLEGSVAGLSPFTPLIGKYMGARIDEMWRVLYEEEEGKGIFAEDFGKALPPLKEDFTKADEEVAANPSLYDHPLPITAYKKVGTVGYEAQGPQRPVEATKRGRGRPPKEKKFRPSWGRKGTV